MFEAFAIFIIGIILILQLGSCAGIIRKAIDRNTRQLEKGNVNRNRQGI
jgi:hypothetical protein